MNVDDDEISRLIERVAALDRLMEAKFVTFQVLVDSQAEKVALALSASEKAITKAEAATEKRFDSVNEFRLQLTDQAATFARREYVEQQITTIAERIAEQVEARSSLLPREVFDTSIAASTLDRASLRDRISELESRINVAAGVSQGGTAKIVDQRASLAAYIGIATFVIGLIVIVANILSSR